MACWAATVAESARRARWTSMLAKGTPGSSNKCSSRRGRKKDLTGERCEPPPQHSRLKRALGENVAGGIVLGTMTGLLTNRFENNQALPS